MLLLRQARVATRHRQCTGLRPAVVSRKWRRNLLTLAIETSCDDTSVALVEKFNNPDNPVTTKVHFLRNITADTQKYRGIHPVETLLSHQEHLAKLLQSSLESLPLDEQQQSPSRNEESSSVRRRLPDFISVTRGPGMRSNLSVGLDTAKGLAVAWQIPLVGVHHMHAHLLTPRLVSAMRGGDDSGPTSTTEPQFPFISILISGAHSLIAHSKSLLDHKILATTVDIGMGTALDKAARPILPQSLLDSTTGSMYGKLLEQFAFPNGPSDYADYQPPVTRGAETERRESKWGWSITPSFTHTRELKLGFANIESTVTRIMAAKEQSGAEMSSDERIDLAREVMRVCFEHLASRMIISLEDLKGQPHVPSSKLKYLSTRQKQYRSSSRHDKVRTLVLSGGVAANGFLIKVLRSFLDSRGFRHIRIIAPPPVLCTDNAAMVGWAGLEMYEAGWRTDLSAQAIRDWTLDPQQPDGGILGPDCWINQNSEA